MKPAHLPFVAAAALASMAAAAATPPHLQKGQWNYQATTTFTSGPMAGRTQQSHWKSCVRESDAPPSLTPHTGEGHTQCTAPKLTDTSHGYRTTMSCTTQTQGMTMKMDQDFTFTPADGGNSVSIDGTVHQTMSGAPMAMPAMDMRVKVRGKRVGACGG